MKKAFLLSLAIYMTCSIQAQQVEDSVSLGAGYANQVWYSLENGILGTQPKDDWDIAFDATGFGSSVRINSATGTQLRVYPDGDTSDWASLDTTGMSSWVSLNNSDTTWGIGAFDMAADPNDPFDLGWGMYSTITHAVTGARIFVIKLSDGSYRKVWIKRLLSGLYTFRYASLDNSMDKTESVDKVAFSTRNFAYYSLKNHTSLDREPVSVDWDLTFTQYSTLLPGFGPYTVTGVLSNTDVPVARVTGIGDVPAYVDFSSHGFSYRINEIGYDWKTFNSSTFSYDIEDSLVFFVEDRPGSIWKVLFTGFGGSANGTFYFTKEKLRNTGVNGAAGNLMPILEVYPNPSFGQDIMIVYEGVASENAELEIEVMDMSGKKWYGDVLNLQAGVHRYTLPAHQLRRGMYLLVISGDGYNKTKKLIIENE